MCSQTGFSRSLVIGIYGFLTCQREPVHYRRSKLAVIRQCNRTRKIDNVVKHLISIDTAGRYSTLETRPVSLSLRPEADSDGHQLSGSLLYGVTRKRTIIWPNLVFSKVHDNEIRHASSMNIGARSFNTYNNFISK